MDEARLKEIEAELIGDLPTEASEFFEIADKREHHRADAIIAWDQLRLTRELIAALRDAWRERDATLKASGEGALELARQIDAMTERAARAEGEVKRLNDYIPVLLSETFQKHQAVSEAAEALLNASYGWDRDFADRQLIGLRRALDAAKDPAR